MKARVLLASLFSAVAVAGEPSPISAINSAGVDLLHQVAKPNDNALISPYSIEMALAMTYAGADGKTREEMARVLHLPKDEAEVHGAFAKLRNDLDAVMRRSVRAGERAKKYGMTVEPLTLTVANRLFGQEGYEFRAPFLKEVKDHYAAPFEMMNFRQDAAGATKRINGWVEEQTHDRIRDLIPPDALNRDTRLVLVNAIYMKAAWMKPFTESETKPAPFHLAKGATVDVPTMSMQFSTGYAKKRGFTALTLSYSDPEIQFLILLPDENGGLAALEKKLTAEQLAECANLDSKEVVLYLPKIRLEPPSVSLKAALGSLGMKSAFDQPSGSANFDRMAPQRVDDYLYISDVFHKAFMNLDEKGTEAAAATAVIMARAAGIVLEPKKPIEVRVNHPFLFAIQHRPTGACLFLGHVVDPR